jgi:hypothetical protein
MDPHRAGGVDTGPYPVEPLELRRAIAHPIGKDGAVVAGDGRKGERRGPGEQAQGVVPVHGAPECGVVTEVAMPGPEGHGVAVDVVGLLVTDPVVPGELQRRKHARPDAVLRPGVLVHPCPVQCLHLGERREGPHDAAQPVGVHQVVVVEEGDDIAGGCIEPRIERRRPTVTGARAGRPAAEGRRSMPTGVRSPRRPNRSPPPARGAGSSGPAPSRSPVGGAPVGRGWQRSPTPSAPPRRRRRPRSIP